MLKPVVPSATDCVLHLEAIEIPCRVVPKARPRVTANGTYNPARYTTSKRRVAFAVKSALLKAAKWGKWPQNMSYGIDLRVCVHKATEGDVDGLVGNVMDACEGLLWVNDRQVIRVHVDKVLIAPTEPVFAVMNVCVYEGTGFEYRTPSKAKKPRVGTKANLFEVHPRKIKADPALQLKPQMTAAEYRKYVEAYRKKHGKVPRATGIAVKAGDSAVQALARRNRKNSLGRRQS
jgi:Holliday junction resolvase RusA-like endonuclease